MNLLCWGVDPAGRGTSDEHGLALSAPAQPGARAPRWLLVPGTRASEPARGEPAPPPCWAGFCVSAAAGSSGTEPHEAHPRTPHRGGSRPLAPPGPGPWVIQADADDHGLLTAHRRKTGILRVKSQGGTGVALPSPPGPRLLWTGVGACGSHQLRDKRRALRNSRSQAPYGSLRSGPSERPCTRGLPAGQSRRGLSL